MREVYGGLPRGLRDSIYACYRFCVWQARNIKNMVKHGTSDFITDLNIEINTSCNRRCEYCPNSLYDRGLPENEKLMPESLFKRIIDELAGIGFDGRISPHHYGEPLLDHRLTDFTTYMREKLPKAKIILVTNGDYLTIGCYNRLIESGVNGFCITQHGARISNNVSELFKYLKKNPGRKVRIDYLKYNERTPLYNRGGEVNPHVINLNPRCKSAHNAVVIDFAGNVILCSNDYHSSIRFGNLNEDSLIEVWNSEYYRLLREQLFKGIYSLDICKRCTGLK